MIYRKVAEIRDHREILRAYGLLTQAGLHPTTAGTGISTIIEVPEGEEETARDLLGETGRPQVAPPLTELEKKLLAALKEALCWFPHIGRTPEQAGAKCEMLSEMLEQAEAAP